MRFCSLHALLMWHHKLSSAGCSLIYVSNLDCFLSSRPTLSPAFWISLFRCLTGIFITEFKTQVTIFLGPLNLHVLLCYCLINWYHHFPSFPIQMGAILDSASLVSSVCIFVHVLLIMPSSYLSIYLYHPHHTYFSSSHLHLLMLIKYVDSSHLIFLTPESPSSNLLSTRGIKYQFDLVINLIRILSWVC